MAEYVGLQAQAPDPLTTLSKLLTISGQRAQVQQEQQSARQRANLAKYDWNKHVGADGTIDLNTLNDPELQAAAGDQYQDVVLNAINTKQHQLESKSKLLTLRNDQRDAFGQMMNALRSDSDVAQDTDKGRQKVNQAMIQYGEMYGEDVLPILQAYAAPLKNVPRGRMKDALAVIGLQAEDVGNQLSRQAPQYADSGARLLDINPLTPMGAAPQSIDKTLPPGASILTDAKGAQFVFNPQTNSVTPVGQGQQPNEGPSPSESPTSFTQPRYMGQEKDVASNQQEIANTRAAADQAPANRNIFQHILKLADDTHTGPLVSFLQNTKIGGQVFGDNYQELGKYLEKNAIANMQAMGGPPSDARLSAAVAANGSTQFNPKALKAVTEFNYATNTGLERYRNGIDKAVGTENPDYTKLSKFKADWAKSFDIDAFRVENMIADGNQNGARDLINSLSRERAAELRKKMANLDSLAETGKLP